MFASDIFHCILTSNENHSQNIEHIIFNIAKEDVSRSPSTAPLREPSPMSVLVIGAAGAVGKRLIGALASRGRAWPGVWRDEDDLRCLKRVGKPRKNTYLFLPSTCGVEKTSNICVIVVSFKKLLTISWEDTF